MQGLQKFQCYIRGRVLTYKLYAKQYKQCYAWCFALSRQLDAHPRQMFGTNNPANDPRARAKELYDIQRDFRDLPEGLTFSTTSVAIHYRLLMQLRSRCQDCFRGVGSQRIETALLACCPEILEHATADEEYRLKFWASMLTATSLNDKKSHAIDVLETTNRNDVGTGDLRITFLMRSIPKHADACFQLAYEARHAVMTIRRKQRSVTLDVLFCSDRCRCFRSQSVFKNKRTGVLNKCDVPLDFKTAYLSQMSLRDQTVLTPADMIKRCNAAFAQQKQMQACLFHQQMQTFKRQRPVQKLETITLLLMLPQKTSRRDAELMLDVMFKDPDHSREAEAVRDAVDVLFAERLQANFEDLTRLRRRRGRADRADISYETRIESMCASEDVKQRAFRQLKVMKRSKDGDVKVQTYLDNLLRIPFGVYREETMLACLPGIARDLANLQTRLLTIKQLADMANTETSTQHHMVHWVESLLARIDEQYPDVRRSAMDLRQRLVAFDQDRKQYCIRVRQCLDSSVYGHQAAKDQLERIVCQWITGKQDGVILGLQGPPGVGKTSLIKYGLSRCLVDADGKERPFVFLPLGGMSGASFLVGHNFTYQGSRYGRIAGALMDAGCLNPVIFIDELDKISRTERGEEVVGILTHLTDSTQNQQFYDRYFAGIPLDISKALIVFSFNDIDRIDPVLRDRITCIRVDPLDTNDKLEISRQFLLPEILDTVGFRRDDVSISPNDLQYIIRTFTFEAGVRRLKQILYHVVREINRRVSQCLEKRTFPTTLDRDFLNNCLAQHPRKLRRLVGNVPVIGIINGMYANTFGVGGITTIEVSRFRCREPYGFKLTGQQGDVMKESMECAKTVAFNLLDEAATNAYQAKPFGLHVHCPEASVRKDGPSAGAAIATALYSYLSDAPIDASVALTGELDLHGNVRAVGGLQAKLHGVKAAGVQTALVPSENKEDIRCLRLRGKLPTDHNFKIIFVDHVRDAIKIMCGRKAQQLP